MLKDVLNNWTFNRKYLRDFLGKERYKMLRQAFMYTRNEKVYGDYLEFGVAGGRSLMFADRIAHKDKMNFIGFDSFGGFPQPTGKDEIFERFRKGEAKFSQDLVQKYINRWCPEPGKVHLVNGWFKSTLSKGTKKRYQISKARIVNIDCDMYESSKLALNFIDDLVQDGTVIMFDDWLCFRGDPDKGEQAAAREWLKKHPKLRLIPYRNYANVGQAFILSIKK